MIKYYPLTRIKPDLYTRGDEYRLPNGQSYVGKYYLTYDLQAFTGINPVIGTNEPLSRIREAETAASNTLASTNVNVRT